MLLSVYHEKCLIKSTSWYISEKYDGWRMTYQNGTFYSRTGQELKVPAPMRKEMEQFCGESDILDGELWLGYGKFTEIQAALNSGSSDLTFLVFDMPSADGSFQDRLSLLKKKLLAMTTAMIKIVEQVQVDATDVSTIDTYYNTVIEKGGEGIVLKPMSMMYDAGKRSDIFLKRKPWDTMEVKIVGHFTTDAQKNDGCGYVSSLVCEVPTGNKTFKVQYKSYNAPAIGTTISIKYSQTTVNGLPKFPQMLKSSLDGPVAPKPNCPKIIDDNALTFSQWKTRGGYALENGEEVHVKSDRSNEIYVVKKAKKGDSVYCSCQAWKYQKLNPLYRTCKHCVAVLGAKEDAIRVAKAVLG